MPSKRYFLDSTKAAPRQRGTVASLSFYGLLLVSQTFLALGSSWHTNQAVLKNEDWKRERGGDR